MVHQGEDVVSKGHSRHSFEPLSAPVLPVRPWPEICGLERAVFEKEMEKVQISGRTRKLKSQPGSQTVIIHPTHCYPSTPTRCGQLTSALSVARKRTPRQKHPRCRIPHQSTNPRPNPPPTSRPHRKSHTRQRRRTRVASSE